MYYKMRRYTRRYIKYKTIYYNTIYKPILHDV